MTNKTLQKKIKGIVAKMEFVEYARDVNENEEIAVNKLLSLCKEERVRFAESEMDELAERLLKDELLFVKVAYAIKQAKENIKGAK